MRGYVMATEGHVPGSGAMPCGETKAQHCIHGHKSHECQNCKGADPMLNRPWTPVDSWDERACPSYPPPLLGLHAVFFHNSLLPGVLLGGLRRKTELIIFHGSVIQQSAITGWWGSFPSLCGNPEPTLGFSLRSRQQQEQAFSAAFFPAADPPRGAMEVSSQGAAQKHPNTHRLVWKGKDYNSG